MKNSSLRNRKLIFLSIVLLLGLWAIFSNVINNSIYLPSLKEVFTEFLGIVSEVGFFQSIVSSIWRSVESFFIALVVALILGILSAFNKYIYNFIYPLLAVIRSIPTIAFILIALIWVNKDMAPILIGTIIAFPIFYELVVSSIIDVDRNLLEMGEIYRISRLSMISNIYAPNICFNILRVFTSTLSLILKVVIAGEVYGQPEYGIGAAIQLEKMNLNTSAIFAWIIIVCIITVLFDYVLGLINKKTILKKVGDSNAV